MRSGEPCDSRKFSTLVNVASTEDLQKLSDSDFLEIVEALTLQVHDQGNLLIENLNGYWVIFVGSGQNGELLTVKRERTFPLQAQNFVLELREVLDIVEDEQGTIPNSVCVVTDTQLNNQLVTLLHSEDIGVIDAIWFEENVFI